ncbi:putative membrane protein YqiK [Roseiarcus fermentans]|uniref:Putative membrane protein YqiK n=1 Tax=Roseiarcus fermentans TaxID=1473586 RepID=A0A366FN71_9HYPH|nr:flotillin domain-containing protein [Roseiarcus fermentans]RBP16144.1 putative membrane protein YqiK [Roseiarcus fermentans]
MNGADIIAVIILAAIVIAILAYLMHWLYRRSTKDVSFVRTGLGGEKVIMGGGAFILPIVHDLTEVGMNTLRLQVTRAREKALITKDRMRIELEVEFYLRVVPNAADVATAARTLGRRTMEPEKLRELVQGRFVDAMGSVAASMTLEEMHERRDRFIAGVKAEVVKNLGQNGLELEAVSLVSLDQADMKLFNPANAFDAEGLTRLTEEIESRKKKRNDIEQDTLIAIRNKNLEAEKMSLEIGRETEYARLAQESEIARRRAQQAAEVERERAASERDIEAAKIQEREEVERTRIAMERTLEALEIGRLEARELAEQAREIAVAEKSQERSRIQAAAEDARRALLEAQERVETARETEVANRRREIDLIGARRQAEVEAVRITLLAQADKAAASDRADADRITVAALKERSAVESEARRAVNEAENLRSDASRRSALHQKLVEVLPSIIRESVKPMERIEGIKILHVEGLPGLSSPGPANGGGAGGESAPHGPRDGNLAEEVVSSALRYRAQAPFVDTLLGEIGLSSAEIHRTQPLQNLSKIVYSRTGEADGGGEPAGR